MYTFINYKQLLFIKINILFMKVDTYTHFYYIL